MLDDLVAGFVCATADNPTVLASLVVLDSYSIFAHVFEPDKLEGARTIAVDALSLVLADDDVLQDCSGFE